MVVDSNKYLKTLAKQSKNVQVKTHIVPKHAMHSYLQDLIFVAQFLGIFCVQKNNQPDVNNISFKWGSFRMAYGFGLFCVCLCCSVVSLAQAWSSKIVIFLIVKPVFYFGVCLNILVFLKIAKKWPEFIKKVHETEQSLVQKYPIENKKIRRNVNIITLIVYLFGTVEHSFLTLVLATPPSYCQNTTASFEYYSKKHFEFMFTYMPYNVFGGLLLSLHSWIATFIWIYNDIFIIVICYVMIQKYKQIRLKMKYYSLSVSDSEGTVLPFYKGEVQKENILFWRNIREDYTKLNRMSKKLNNMLSDPILLSYSFNLLFIIIQLFSSIRLKEAVIDNIYFVLSFGFVVSRTVTVSIFGGWLLEESRAPLMILNTVPTETYNQEIVRLIWQIHTSPPVLTGHNFFIVTKGLVLSVAAAIVTYELVLIQFNEKNLTKMELSETTQDIVC